VDEAKMNLNDEVEVTQMWIPPNEYETVRFVDLDKPASEAFPDGIFTRILTTSQTVLSMQNATREEAERLMYK
jgi:hypothetical protein